VGQPNLRQIWMVGEALLLHPFVDLIHRPVPGANEKNISDTVVRQHPGMDIVHGLQVLFQSQENPRSQSIIAWEFRNLALSNRCGRMGNGTLGGLAQYLGQFNDVTLSVTEIVEHSSGHHRR